jgi:hypothetical protein
MNIYVQVYCSYWTKIQSHKVINKICIIHPDVVELQALFNSSPYIRSVIRVPLQMEIGRQESIPSQFFWPTPQQYHNNIILHSTHVLSITQHKLFHHGSTNFQPNKWRLPVESKQQETDQPVDLVGCELMPCCLQMRWNRSHLHLQCSCLPIREPVPRRIYIVYVSGIPMSETLCSF